MHEVIAGSRLLTVAVFPENGRLEVPSLAGFWGWFRRFLLCLTFVAGVQADTIPQQVSPAPIVARVPIGDALWTFDHAPYIQLQRTAAFPLRFWQDQRSSGISDVTGAEFWGPLFLNGMSYEKLIHCPNACGFQTFRGLRFAIAMAAHAAIMTDIAYGRPFRGGALPTAAGYCPMGLSYPNDGCAALLASGNWGTVQYANMFSAGGIGPGSGQSYTLRSPENQVDVDYPGGVPQIYYGHLKDPANINSDVPSCTYNATGGSGGGPQVTCTGGSNISIQQYEFGPINGHQATCLLVRYTNTGTPTLRYNDFDNDANTMACANANNYPVYLGDSGSTFNWNFSNNTINGECQAWNCTLGNYRVYSLSYGSRTEDYDAFLWMPVRQDFGGGGATAPTVGDTNFQWSLFIGQMTSAVHGETIIDIMASVGTPSVQQNTNYIGDVIVIPFNAEGGQSSTATIYVSGGAAPIGPPTWTNTTITDSTMITNLGHDPGTGPGTASAIIDFANGIYINVTIARDYMDGTGLQNGGFLRADCRQAGFLGGLNGTTGVLTVTSWGGNGIVVGTLGDILYYGGASSGLRITSQLTGTAGQNGTYQTAYSGADIPSEQMYAYGGSGSTATFSNPVNKSSIYNMVSGAAISSFDDPINCFVYAP